MHSPLNVKFVAHNTGHYRQTPHKELSVVLEKKQCECQQPVILDISVTCLS